MHRPFVALGASSAAIAVAAGAFGAHALRARIEPRLLEVFETAARYQMYHALALIAVGLLLARGADAEEAGAEGADAEGADAEEAGEPGAPGATGLRDSASRLTQASGWLFVAGTLLFSGSLYAMALSGVTVLGAITPLGGVCFIAGWVCLALGAMRAR